MINYIYETKIPQKKLNQKRIYSHFKNSIQLILYYNLLIMKTYAIYFALLSWRNRSFKFEG